MAHNGKVEEYILHAPHEVCNTTKGVFGRYSMCITYVMPWKSSQLVKRKEKTAPREQAAYERL